MRIQPEISGVEVVIRGDFNPAIFTPAWFALHGLLPDDVADDADLGIVHEQVTQFETDWLRLQVRGDRFLAETSQAPHVRLRDLIVRVFNEFLHHTPLRAFGINRSVHFQVRSFAERERIGRALAPVEPWGAWRQRLQLDGEESGMKSLTMSQVNPTGRPTGGEINVTVEPSSRVGKSRTGVLVKINDHYAIENTKLGTAERSMELFEDNFETSLERSDQIIDHIMSLAETKEE